VWTSTGTSADFPKKREVAFQSGPGRALFDHFSPWARHPDNGIENLVAADGRYNNDKRDFVASTEHLQRWTDTHFEPGSRRKRSVRPSAGDARTVPRRSTRCHRPSSTSRARIGGGCNHSAGERVLPVSRHSIFSSRSLNRCPRGRRSMAYASRCAAREANSLLGLSEEGRAF
jgi:hypothetical protein